MSGRAVPREEGVTFESGSGGMRMEKGRGAAAAGQPLYRPLNIRAGRLSDPPFGGHLPENSRTASLCVVTVCLSAPSTVCHPGPVVVRLAEMAN